MFGDYQTARLMQASSTYSTDLHQISVGIPQDPRLLQPHTKNRLEIKSQRAATKNR